MMSTQGGFSFNNFLGTSALGDMREDIDELDDRALFTDGTKSMKGTLGMGGNLIVGFTAIEGQELAVGILPATGHVSIYAKTDKMLYIQDDTGLESNITIGGAGGDVVGPVSSVDGEVALFDGVTGKLIKAGQIQMDGAGGMTDVVSMEMTNVVTVENTIVQLLDVDAQGFAPTTAIGIALNTGAITDGDILTANLNSIDESASLGGRVFGNAVFTTSNGQADVHAMGAAVNVNPIYQQSGTHIDALSLDNNGSDVTTDLSQGGGGNITIFANLNDDFTIGSSSKYSEIEFILDIDSSNGGIQPLFEFSDGVGSFATFAPLDGTNGMRNSGIIQWDNTDIPTWVLDGEFLIRITRQRTTINTPPRSDLVQIASVTTYEWDKFGDVNIRSLDVNSTVVSSSAISLKGVSGSGLEIDMGGFVDIRSDQGNTQAIKIVATNAVAGLLIQSNTGGSEIISSGPVDLATSVNSPGIGLTLRSTGVNGTIDMTSGLGGVRITDGGVGLFMEDTSSLFAIQFAVPVMAADYKLTYPAAQGAVDGQSLVNDSSGNLRWDFGIAAFPTGHINGLGMTNGTTTDTDKDIKAGQCRDESDVFNIVVPSLLTIDNTVSGVGGLDTGSLTANTWYAIHVIADTTLSAVPAGLMSLSDTAPTLPGTYDVFRRVGWARTDGSSDFYKAFYGEAGQSRIAYWDESEVILEVLTDGSATSYTVVDCSEWVPPVSGFAYFNTNHFASDEQDFLTLAPTNLVPDLAGESPVADPRANRTFGGASAGDATGSTFQFMIISDSAGEILYANSSGSEDSDIWVIAYIDSLVV